MSADFQGALRLMLFFILSLIIAYALGSLLFDRIAIKAYEFITSDEIEPTTNSSLALLRSPHWPIGLAALIGDILKGIIAIAVAIILGLHGFWLMLSGLAVIVGHHYSAWFKFKGSRDFSANLGVYVGLAIGVAFFAALVYAFFVYKRLSLARGALASAVVAIVLVGVFGYGLAYILGFALMAALTYWVHLGKAP